MSKKPIQSGLASRGNVLLGVLAGVALIVISPFVAAEEIQSRIARGGLLYDKWYSVVGGDAPSVAHASYPKDGKYLGKSGADWRCKECHGWDYKGAGGAYSKGSHFTGIKGIEAFAGADPEKIVMKLKDPVHGYTDDMMSADDFMDLALFVSKGQLDMDQVIDRSSKKVKGDAVAGEPLFNNICAHCHGKDGKGIEDGEPLGEVAKDNPWEALHKVRNGQPDEQMPSLHVLDQRLLLDILAYMQTLPDK